MDDTRFSVATDDNRFAIMMNHEQLREGRGKGYLRDPFSSAAPFCALKSREQVVRIG